MFCYKLTRAAKSFPLCYVIILHFSLKIILTCYYGASNERYPSYWKWTTNIFLFFDAQVWLRKGILQG